MFENYQYQATNQDFAAIERGIKTALDNKLHFIFNRRKVITNTTIISYDQKFIYLWTSQKIPNLNKFNCNLKNYYGYKISHKIKIKPNWQSGWITGLPQKLLELLPPNITEKSRFEFPIISGGLISPFIELQKKKNFKNNPYTSRQSYTATIIHEFAHAYWNYHKLWWFSNKKRNINYLQIALNLYKKNPDSVKTNLELPVNFAVGELFAFCTEYQTSKIFWPTHKTNLDTFYTNKLTKLINKEKEKNLETQDSVIELRKHPHNFAFVFGKILTTKYPKTWPKILANLSMPLVPQMAPLSGDDKFLQ